MNHLKVTTPMPGSEYPGSAEVILDGQNISRLLRGLDVHLTVQGTEVSLNLGLVSVGFDGFVKSNVDAATRNLLVSLGWTPPMDPRPTTAKWDSPLNLPVQLPPDLR